MLKIKTEDKPSNMKKKVGNNVCCMEYLHKLWLSNCSLNVVEAVVHVVLGEPLHEMLTCGTKLTLSGCSWIYSA